MCAFTQTQRPKRGIVRCGVALKIVLTVSVFERTEKASGATEIDE